MALQGRFFVRLLLNEHAMTRNEARRYVRFFDRLEERERRDDAKECLTCRE